MVIGEHKLLDDCFAHDKRRLRHDEALAILKERVRPVAGEEPVSLADAAGRILAAAAVAPHPVPAHTNAAVDGFSFAAADYDAAAGTRLTVEGRAAAGHPLKGRPRRGTAVRIFTGAMLPDGHDTVVMQEDVRTGEIDGRLAARIPAGVKRGANVRKAGEDVKEGATVLAPGAVLRPQDVAALASLGFGEVTCFRRLRVAIVSTGDEVVRAGAPLKPGQVHDANAPMLAALSANAGAAPVDLGVFADELDAVKEKLREAAHRFDVILTTGGASRGEEDHMVAALDALGKRHLAACHQARPAHVIWPDRRRRGAGAAGQPGGGVRVLPALCLAAVETHGRGGVAGTAPLPAAGAVRLSRSQGGTARVLARHPAR